MMQAQEKFVRYETDGKVGISVGEGTTIDVSDFYCGCYIAAEFAVDAIPGYADGVGRGGPSDDYILCMNV